MVQPKVAPEARPWQLEMFDRSLKKRLKLAALRPFVRASGDDACLLISCGDNNGALNWHFRAGGGRWAWGDVAGENVAEMTAFLAEPVRSFPPDALPYDDDAFDRVVAIDVLEHLDDDLPFLDELYRVLRPGGTAVLTVPNGDPRLLANRVKWRVGMTPKVYGHTRAGYTVPELQAAAAAAGFEPSGSGGYSRFFTEMMELVINFGYVFVLSRKSGGATAGQIAPTTAGQMKTHGLAYRFYQLAFPVLRLVSGLDRLLPARGDGAVIVAAVKPEIR